jgi:hypothetical protein
MAATYAKHTPLKGHPIRISWAIFDMSIGRAYSGGLTGLSATVSKDGGNYASTTSSPVEIQTSGTGYLELSAAEMTADTVIVKISCTDPDSSQVVEIINPLDPTENAGHWMDAGTGLVKWEQGQLHVIQEAANKQEWTYATGKQTIFDKDGNALNAASYSQTTNSSNQEIERRAKLGAS